jgi:RimJ/RimL family protein N-acetyltransferase
MFERESESSAIASRKESRALAGKIPTIRKARRIIGNRLVFRDAEIGDAEFILALRTDPKKSRFLSPTNPDISAQVAWLQTYQLAADQAYFVIQSPDGEKVGTVRLYDQRGQSFSWGSWILKDGVSRVCAIESALVVYHYALGHLGFTGAHFGVRKANLSVCAFHERCGAIVIGETHEDYHYKIELEQITAWLDRCSTILPSAITVIC